MQGAFRDRDKCAEFRDELTKLQDNLRAYTKMLSELADVEDMTDMEDA